MTKRVAKKTFNGREPGSTDEAVNEFMRTLSIDDYISYSHSYSPETGEIFVVAYLVGEDPETTVKPPSRSRKPKAKGRET